MSPPGPSPAYLELFGARLAMLSEGACPDHGTALRLSGWCVRCQA